MVPLDKVKDIIGKHDLLEKELASGNIDPKLFAKIQGVFSSWRNYCYSKRVY